jgi:hypothetical protein
MLTKKDLEIINQALAQYEALCEEIDGGAFEHHKQNYGNPEKTINATRGRVFQEIAKRKATK